MGVRFYSGDWLYNCWIDLPHTWKVSLLSADLLRCPPRMSALLACCKSGMLFFCCLFFFCISGTLWCSYSKIFWLVCSCVCNVFWHKSFPLRGSLGSIVGGILRPLPPLIFQRMQRRARSLTVRASLGGLVFLQLAI